MSDSQPLPPPFEPIGQGYADGRGRSCMGYALERLGIDQVILEKLVTCYPFLELEAKHGIRFFASPTQRERVDADAAQIEFRYDAGRMAIAMQMLSQILRDYEGPLCAFVTESAYLKLRLEVVEWLEKAQLTKVFPRRTKPV